MLRPRTEGIVIHRAEVWDNDEYHFVVRRDGGVLPVVPLDHKAMHAKAYNSSTVGVAFEGDFAAAEQAIHGVPTEAQLAAGVQLVADLRATYGQLWIKGHSELGAAATSFPEKLSYDPDHSCPGTRFGLDAFKARCG